MSRQNLRIAIIGSGPAGLMAASQLARAGIKITVFEKRPGPGRKLLIAGGSGLNISNSLPPDEFISHYSGGIDWKNLFGKFSVSDWLRFVENLGLETFEGTSGRYFVREMKASGLLTRWIKSLEGVGCSFIYGHDCVGIEKNSGTGISLSFARKEKLSFDAVLFCTGGASWLSEEMSWPRIFSAHSVAISPFCPRNAGFSVAWKPEFLAEAANQPLKNVEFISNLGRKKGDLMITEYGLEGTPVYFFGQSGNCSIDLKPDLTAEEITTKLDSVSENMSPLRRAPKKLRLDDVALALLYHHAPAGAIGTNAGLARIIKSFPITLTAVRPLTEAISSSGGIALDEIDVDFQLRKVPGAFAAGEMLDWHAPTGGFLIQACVSQGYVAAQGILRYLNA